MYQMPKYYGMSQIKSTKPEVHLQLAQVKKDKKIKEVELVQENELDEDTTPDGQEFELEQVNSDVNT